MMEDQENHTQTLDIDSSLVKRAGSSAQVLPVTKPWGRLVSLNPANSHVDVYKDEIALGRHIDCDVRLTDGCISGHHCKLLRRREPEPAIQHRAFVEDNSSNGTYINGQRLPKGKPVRLRHRDELALSVPSSLEAQKSETFKRTFCSYIFQDLRAGAHDDNTLTEGSLKRTITMELAPHLLDAKRARIAAAQKRYYEMDEDALLKSGGQYLNPEGRAGSARVIRLSRPHVADTSPAAEQFKTAELAFRRFVNRDRMFSVRQVDVLLNPALEARFRQQERAFAERPHASLREAFAGQPQRERRIIEALCDSIWWSTDGQNDGSNPLLAWHGTKEENLPAIARDGFRLLSEKDPGWYGRGIYFTQLPNYGEFYINNCTAEHGESFSLILSWLLMGNPYPVTRKMDGAGLMPSYDSHFCLVKGFDPCPEGEDPTGDEIVIFQPAQILPRYIVRYEIKKKAKFTPISLLDSSGEEDADEDEEQAAAPPAKPVALAPESKAPPTGEEDEETVCSMRAKLFALVDQAWEDKGVGPLRLNYDPATRRARIVMRLEATGAVLLNSAVFAGMRCGKATERAVRMVCAGPQGPITCLLRVAKPEEAEALVGAVARFAALPPAVGV